MIGLLGNLEVRVGGTPVPVGHARQKAVLAVLLTETNRVVPLDRLIDRVWGEHMPLRARSVLRTYLSNLRKALHRTGITITWNDTGYQLDTDPDCVDLHRFRRLIVQAGDSDSSQEALTLADEALALWRGEPLAELDTPWAQSVREQLYREWAAARVGRIDWALECGRHAEVLPELTTQATEHPLDERTAGQVMLALYRSGRQADALECYQHIRQRLTEELGAVPGSALQELHQRILTADPTLILPLVDAPNLTVVPRQLPAPPTPFVGRRDELDRLDTALDASDHVPTVVISALAGAGGIGKTWLALHWAHRHVDLFPDGQLFVNLRGFSSDGEPLDPAVAVRGFLDALGVDPGRVPADLDVQAALYRSLIAGRRMLIVLDNAATAHQVIPLLPGAPTCTVLVTSRSRLASLVDRYGAHHLQLDVLPREEAHALLVGRLGIGRVAVDSDAVDELIELCGRYPLALAITVRHASFRPQVPLAEFAAELRELGLDMLDDDDPTASLPAVLSWSLHTLTPEQQTVFALLGIAPGPDATLPAIVSLTGLHPARTRKALSVLEEASLVQRRPHGRYAMHDLVRAYAASIAEHLPTEVSAMALRRVFDFYTHTSHIADRLLNPHRQPIQLDSACPGTQLRPLPDYPTALAWFDTHYPHLLAAQHTATAHQRHQTVVHLAWGLGSFLQKRGRPHDELATWQSAAAAVAQLPDRATHSLVHRRLGRIYTELGRHKQAISHLRQALALAEDDQDRAQQAHIHQSLARSWETQGNYQEALEHARHALNLHRRIEQPVWEAGALNQAGWFAARLGHYDTAFEHCLAALALYRRHHVPDGEANALDSLGFIDHCTGDHHQAIHRYQQALTLHRERGNTIPATETLDNLGHPHAALGRHEQARAAWQEALELYRQQGRRADAERVQRQLRDLDQPAEETKTAH